MKHTFKALSFVMAVGFLMASVSGAHADPNIKYGPNGGAVEWIRPTTNAGSGAVILYTPNNSVAELSFTHAGSTPASGYTSISVGTYNNTKDQGRGAEVTFEEQQLHSVTIYPANGNTKTFYPKK